eukprot:1158293-Pelagomonas_calceolata.AAC.16
MSPSQSQKGKWWWCHHESSYFSQPCIGVQGCANKQGHKRDLASADTAYLVLVKCSLSPCSAAAPEHGTQKGIRL